MEETIDTFGGRITVFDGANMIGYRVAGDIRSIRISKTVGGGADGLPPGSHPWRPLGCYRFDPENSDLGGDW